MNFVEVLQEIPPVDCLYTPHSSRLFWQDRIKNSEKHSNYQSPEADRNETRIQVVIQSKCSHFHCTFILLNSV